MVEMVQALAGTPIPTILVVAGIVFLLLSVADKVSGHLTIPGRAAETGHVRVADRRRLPDGVGAAEGPHILSCDRRGKE